MFVFVILSLLSLVCYYSHMDMHLLVLKTFQTVHFLDEIPLSHNSLWLGCIICVYSGILGQQTVGSCCVTFHFWNRGEAYTTRFSWWKRWWTETIICLGWKKKQTFISESLYFSLSHQRHCIAGAIFFTLCLSLLNSITTRITINNAWSYKQGFV